VDPPPPQRAAPSSPAARGLALLMRATPYTHRYRLAVHLSRLALPVVRRVPALRAPATWGYADTSRVIMLLRLLGTTVPYVPAMRVEGDPSWAQGGENGVLCVGPRSALTPLIVRYLGDRGLRPLPVASDERYAVAGATETIPTLFAGSTQSHSVDRSSALLRAVRRALGDRRLVVAALGYEAIVFGGSFPERDLARFDTAAGPMTASVSLLHLAARCEAGLCFAAARVATDGAVVLTLARPPAGKLAPAEAVAAYIAFVQRHAETVLAG